MELNKDRFQYFTEATKAETEGKYEEAIVWYDKLLEIDPEDAKAWNNKGAALGKLGKYDEAIACYDRAIEINPKDLRPKAWKLETEAEKAKKEKNYEKAAELHLKAAEVHKQIGDEKNWKWNLANYYSTKGGILSWHDEFDKARESYKKAEDIFLELKMRKPAFSCGVFSLRTYYHEKQRKGKGVLISQQYINSIKQFLDQYKEFSNNEDYIWGEFSYWNSMAHIFEKEKGFIKAAECYGQSAQIISKIDKNISEDEYINQYKCLSIAHKYDKNKFEEYIDKAIEIIEKKKDEKQKFYYLGLKYDHLARFTDDIESSIKYLRQAKESYYRAEDKESGKMTDFILLFNLSRKMLKDGNYREAIDFLGKTISAGKDVKFPNIISSLDVLDNEKPLYEGYSCFSEGEFDNAAKLWQQWLDKNQKIENTKIYQFRRVLKCCSEMLSKSDFSGKNLLTVEDNIRFVRENKLGISLYDISALTYSFITLWICGVKNKEILEEIKLRIIEKTTREEIAEDLRHRLKVQRAIGERDWLFRLPPVFLEKFDSSLYLLNDILEDYIHLAVLQFYVLLEKFLEVIVEFNAETLWQEDWKSEIEKNIVKSEKPFEIFTFGLLVESLNFLKNNDAIFCKDISDEILELLKKHTPIRNSLRHTFKRPEKFDIVGDTSRIMYSLLDSFPTCIKVIDTRKMPWYNVEMLWSQLPKRVSLYTGKKLKEGYYYAEPMLGIEENKLSPKVIIPISLSTVKN